MAIAQKSIWAIQEMTAEIAVRGEQRCRESSGRQEPCGIRQLQSGRTCPHADLVMQQMFGQSEHLVFGSAIFGSIFFGGLRIVRHLARASRERVFGLLWGWIRGHGSRADGGRRT